MISHILDIPIPIAEKILRTVLVYVALIVLLRVFGKRELAQLNPFDLIVLLMLSNTVQNAIIGGDNSLMGGVIGAAALLLTNYVMVRLLFHYPRLERLLGGAPRVLIANGQPDTRALRDELLTVRELRLAANRQGIGDLREVSVGEIEPNGAFSFERHHLSREDRHRAELTEKIAELSHRIDRLLQHKQ